MNKQEKLKLLTSQWTIAQNAAILVIRGDARFIGQNKLRDQMIERAAFLACTGEAPTNALFARIAITDPDLAKELDTLIDKAAEAGRQALTQ